MLKVRLSSILYAFLGLSCIVISLLITSCSSSKEELEKKPNIVFFFTDDQTYKAVHALGNSTIITPNLDRLVADGTTFTHAYNMGGWNGAICAASRAMLQSGRSLWRANEFRQKWIDNDSVALDQTWARLMERNGYDTYMTGKWHVDAPASTIFQTASHIRPGMPRDHWNQRKKDKEAYKQYESLEDIMPVGYNRPTDPNDNSWSPVDTSMGGFWQGGKHWSEVIKDDAISFINSASNKENPFFMYLAFNAPHDPRQAPQSFLDLYPIDSIPLPDNWLPFNPYALDIGNSPGLRDEALAPFPRTEHAIRKHIQEYYAIITHLDEQIGEILNELEAKGLMENTHIIFTADHGLAVGQHGFIGKQNQYDHSIRVPLVITGPGIPKNEKRTQCVYLQDIMPTTLELANIDQPEYVEFQSLILYTKNKNEPAKRNNIYGAYIDFQRMIKVGDYKLIVYPKISKTLLYNLKDDPEEQYNIAVESANKSKVLEMLATLIKEQELLNDNLDLKSLLNQLDTSI
ncbi:MAG: arylsulfatase A-like enzyme [Saprospiraceae bacterium]|jgi:arylsulfatase A-like enzyme